MSRHNTPESTPPSFPQPEDRAEIAALWQDIFHDSGACLDLFFSRVYRPENTLVIKKAHRITASLQMIPHEIKTPVGILPSAYVCGVFTHPAERGKGLMTTLMTEALLQMRRRGYAASTLIPSEARLFDLYRKFGYTHPAGHRIERHTSGPPPLLPMPGHTLVAASTAAHFPYFDRKQRERPSAVLHDAFAFETILRDLTCEGGAIWVLLRGNNPLGMAFVKPLPGHHLLIKELLYNTPPIKKLLISHLLRRYNALTAEVRLPPSTNAPLDTNIPPYGLTCIFDERLLPLPALYMTLMLD